jgi:O-antigen/teichoic acid export membrane protein
MAVQKLKESWPLIFAGVAVSLFLKIDQIMIKEILTDSAAGSYAAAVRLSETWYFIPMMITTSLFPAIVNAKVRNDGSHLIRMQRLFDLMIYLSFAIALPITFLSPFIIELLFGIEYIAAAQILIIQIWTSIFISLGVASGVWLINENKQKLIFLQTTLGAVLNIVLNFIFIPSYGIVAAALTSAFSQLFASLLFDLFFKSTRILFTMKLKAIFFVSLVRKNNS